MEELLPGVEFACEATYILTQADVDAAVVMNNASVSGVARDVESSEVRCQGGRQATLFVRVVQSSHGQRLWANV